MKLFAALLLLSVSAFAADRAPLPKQILDAHTVWIENRTDNADVADGAYSFLKHWGRFTFAASREAADVVFVFTEGIPTPTSSSTTGAIVGNSVMLNSGSSVDRSVTLTITTPSGARIWSNSKAWSRRGATTDLMRDLRKRID
jgi:hypothetical protein